MARIYFSHKFDVENSNPHSSSMHFNYNNSQTRFVVCVYNSNQFTSKTSHMCMYNQDNSQSGLLTFTIRTYNVLLFPFTIKTYYVLGNMKINTFQPIAKTQSTPQWCNIVINRPKDSIIVLLLGSPKKV